MFCAAVCVSGSFFVPLLCVCVLCACDVAHARAQVLAQIGQRNPALLEAINSVCVCVVCVCVCVCVYGLVCTPV